MDKKEVIRWLEDYTELVRGYSSSVPSLFNFGNCGFGSGLDGAVKKVILDQALEWMPLKYRKAIWYRWIEPVSWQEARKLITVAGDPQQVSESTFKRRCDRGVDFILIFIEKKKVEYWKNTRQGGSNVV